jgi:hypothetical protein
VIDWSTTCSLVPRDTRTRGRHVRLGDPARSPCDPVTTRFRLVDYALRDSSTAGRCDCRSSPPKEQHDRQRTQHGPRQRSRETRRGSQRAIVVPRLWRPDRERRTDDQDPRGAGPRALRSVSAAGGEAMTPRMNSNRRPRLSKHEPRVSEWPISCMTAQVLDGSLSRPTATGAPYPDSVERVEVHLRGVIAGHRTLVDGPWAEA